LLDAVAVMRRKIEGASTLSGEFAQIATLGRSSGGFLGVGLASKTAHAVSGGNVEPLGQPSRSARLVDPSGALGDFEFTASARPAA
jgi:hypothetical protein